MGTQSVGIINYGVGNLRSVANAVSEIGATPVVSADIAELRACNRLILPGVGAFPHGMEALQQAGLVEFLCDVGESQTPLLGICLGMQLLTELSTEFGETKGLGLLPGAVTQMAAPENGEKLRLPNVGWLKVKRHPELESKLMKLVFEGIDADASFYFIHSFAVAADNPVAAGTSTYEHIRFASVIARENVIGMQFHPEKSGATGLRMLENFIY